jgi:hypothetical protein
VRAPTKNVLKIARQSGIWQKTELAANSAWRVDRKVMNKVRSKRHLSRPAGMTRERNGTANAQNATHGAGTFGMSLIHCSGQ